MTVVLLPDLTRSLGVHTSIAGGIHLALERAKSLGCNTLQIFSHNPRQWHAVNIPYDAAQKFKELRAHYGIDPVFIHASYLINLAAQDGTVLEKSLALLIQEMGNADAIGAEYVVLHTGSASLVSPDASRRKAAGALKKVAESGTWKAKLLLENTAGERGDISSGMSDLAEIINGAASDLIEGVTVDTCHAFAAGYDIGQREGLAAFVKEIDVQVGREAVKLIHLNDSKKGLGSHVDRHAHIGEGYISMEGMKSFLMHPAFAHVPLILETPKKSDLDDPRNLNVVKKLFGHTA